MGRSDPFVKKFYDDSSVTTNGKTALLGFTNNNWYQGDCYDLSLRNWDINSDWKLKQKYDTIICTRVAYFSKDPEDFIKRCYDNLESGGTLWVDWGLGDHWRFENYKIGWVKDGEHEWAYNKENKLYSTIWSYKFLKHHKTKQFMSWIESKGYNYLMKAIQDEVPNILQLETFEKYFDTKYEIESLWPDSPQLYILLNGTKK